jgi:RHS repeat-associated protein
VHAYSLSNSVRKLTFDAASRITKIIDIPTNAGTGIGPEQNFTYDAAGRILSFSGFTSEGNQTQSFSYDNNGNRLSSTLNGKMSVYYYEANSNKLKQVLGASIRNNTYDAAGSLTSDGARQYVYDDRQRLVQATSTAGLATSYQINSANLRVAKQNGAETTFFVYDGAGSMLGEYDGAGNTIREYFWLGSSMVATHGALDANLANSVSATTKSETAYVYADYLGTPRELISQQSGALVWKWDSLPFGETQPNQNPSNTGIFSFNHRFPGQYKDYETGLHQNWRRDYDANLGRYIESDPIGLGDGTNTYTYSRSKPTVLIDRMGLSSLCYSYRTDTLTLYDKDGNFLDRWSAANLVQSNSRGPWPAGTFPYERTVPGATPGNDNSRYGNIIFTVPGRDSMGVHAARRPQLGCIYTADERAILSIIDTAKIDPLTHITVTGSFGSDCP